LFHRDGLLSPALTARLDRATNLLNEGKCSLIIVSGVTPPGEDDESEAMARYLKAHGVSEDSIIQDHPGPGESVDSIVKIMKERKMKSLALITDYYRLVRLKLRLAHAGETELAQIHMGEWKKDDLTNVLREDVAIYKDMYDWYVLPDSKIFAKKRDQFFPQIKILR
jgi:vancomycin permeability regulator SanA